MAQPLLSLSQEESCPHYDFQQGRLRVIEAIQASQRRPFIMAVFGIPDSGKPYLIESLGNHFEALGLKVKQRDNREKINLYESWTFGSYGIEETLSRDLVMFHCPWDDRSRPWKDQKDPEKILSVAGRNLDLAVGIYNPRINPTMPRGRYDLIIRNSESQEKPIHPYD